jgi:hypothetical protein
VRECNSDVTNIFGTSALRSACRRNKSERSPATTTVKQNLEIPNFIKDRIGLGSKEDSSF